MAKRSFKCFVEQKLGKFPFFLIYALLEWTLIIVLFIDGFLAFFANEFAKFFELKIPCLLCTRINHVLVCGDAHSYYNDSICEAHRKDVSSLAYCHVHKKLSDIRKMCDDCLLSFATGMESDCHIYKSLVRILHKEIDSFMDDDQNIHLTSPATGRRGEAMIGGKNGAQRCSCCGDALKVNSYTRGKSLGLQVSQAPAPSPQEPFVALRNEENCTTELPHIQYTELKFSSDNESEIQDEEDGLKTMQLVKPFGEDAKAVTVPLLESENINEDRTPTLARGSRFFGIPLSDSANASPRWATRPSRKSQFEKTEFASESVEGNAPNEIDGESILHHLKWQVHLDRKSLMALYMELDEERSASAVAANNAMAMITRLQAEKAAVQMEALHYQRMMEEQAEYDLEALQAMNDIFVKREEDIRALEAALEAYKKKHGVLEEADCTAASQGEVDEDYHELKSQSQESYVEKYKWADPNLSFNKLFINGANVTNLEETSSSLDKNIGGDDEVEKPKKIFPGRNSGFVGHSENLDKKLQLSMDDVATSMQPSSITDYYGAKETEQDSKGSLAKKLSDLNELINSLQAEDEFLKHDSATHDHANSCEKRKLLADISESLQMIHHIVKFPSGDNYE